MRTSREREVIDVRTHPSIHCAVIDLFFADGRSDGSSALNVSTVIKMVLSQFCRGRFRLSSSLSCEAPLCLPRTGPACVVSPAVVRRTLSLRHTLSQETRSSVRRERTILRRGHNKIPLGSAAPRHQGSAARSHKGALS